MVYIGKTQLFRGHIKQKGKEQTIKGDKQNGQKEVGLSTVFGSHCYSKPSVEVGAELKILLYEAQQIVIHCMQSAVNEVISRNIRLNRT